jgi:hypothetical protein
MVPIIHNTMRLAVPKLLIWDNAPQTASRT